MAKFIDESKRTHRCGDLRASDVGNEVVLFGWVQNRRDFGGLIFIDLRDREGITQIVFDPDSSPEAHQAAEQARSEWCLGIRGKVRDRGMQKNRKGEMVSAHNPKLATGAVEVLVTDATIFNRSETPPFPIEDTIETREEIRLAHRYLDLRLVHRDHRMRRGGNAARVVHCERDYCGVRSIRIDPADFAARPEHDRTIVGRPCHVRIDPGYGPGFLHILVEIVVDLALFSCRQILYE